MLVHGNIFYFSLLLIYYIALYTRIQTFLYINLLGYDKFIKLFHCLRV
jgi:hypothetical protein